MANTQFDNCFVVSNHSSKMEFDLGFLQRRTTIKSTPNEVIGNGMDGKEKSELSRNHVQTNKQIPNPRNHVDCFRRFVRFEIEQHEHAVINA